MTTRRIRLDDTAAVAELLKRQRRQAAYERSVELWTEMYARVTPAEFATLSDVERRRIPPALRAALELRMWSENA